MIFFIRFQLQKYAFILFFTKYVNNSFKIFIYTNFCFFYSWIVRRYFNHERKEKGE